MKLDGVAEYMPDGDILSVVLYVLDGTKSKSKVVESGTLTVFANNREYVTAEFDRYDGNTDGPIKVAFNHPPVKSGSVKAHVVTATETLDAVFPIQVLPMPDPHVAGSSF